MCYTIHGGSTLSSYGRCLDPCLSLGSSLASLRAYCGFYYGDHVCLSTIY